MIWFHFHIELGQVLNFSKVNRAQIDEISKKKKEKKKGLDPESQHFLHIRMVRMSFFRWFDWIGSILKTNRSDSVIVLL